MNLKDYWFGKHISAYPCIPMTGKTGAQLWREYRRDRLTAAQYGVSLRSPVPGEGIKANDQVITDRKGTGATKIWVKDKNQILNTNALVFRKKCMQSQGSIWELVKARGSLFKITVFIHSKPGFISRKQADIVARSADSAYKQLSEKFGSRHKRAVWRMKMLIVSIPKAIYRWIKEFWL